MPKYELIRNRELLYQIAGSVGHFSELVHSDRLASAYDLLSKALDELESYGYEKDWIDINTNEIIEDIELKD